MWYIYAKYAKKNKSINPLLKELLEAPQSESSKINNETPEEKKQKDKQAKYIKLEEIKSKTQQAQTIWNQTTETLDQLYQDFNDLEEDKLIEVHTTKTDATGKKSTPDDSLGLDIELSEDHDIVTNVGNNVDKGLNTISNWNKHATRYKEKRKKIQKDLHNLLSKKNSKN